MAKNKEGMLGKGTFIIIPAKDEEFNIGPVVRQARKYSENIIVVDDGSRDRTCKIALANQATVLRHISNMGKGAALKTGCDYAVMKGAKILVAMDADGQHDASDLPRFMHELRGHDIVFGARTFNKNMPAVLKMGNIIINRVTRILYNIKLHDTLCGYRAFTAEAYTKIRWNASDYSLESEMVANAGRHKLKYKEISIDTIYSDKYKGTTVLDGMKIVLDLFYWKLTGGNGRAGKL